MAYLHDEAYIRLVPSPYTPSQVNDYLERITWPRPTTGDNPFGALSDLMLMHSTTFPSENTDLHYWREHRMSVRPDEAFERMVRRGKGSYCFGQNGLFLGILRALGYRAYPVFGRVLAPDGTYTTPAHMLLPVQPFSSTDPIWGKVTFVVDVGFAGLLGPLRPILLADAGEENREEQRVEGGVRGGWVWGTFPPVRHRVVRGAYPTSSLETSAGSGLPPLREWHMQVSRRPPSATDEEWRTLYTFSEAEIFQRDIDAANLIMSIVDAAPFRDILICSKRFIMTEEDIVQAGYSMDDAGEKEVLETVQRREEIRWVRSWSLEDKKAVSRVGGKVVEEIVLGSEEARVKVVREKMGLAVEDSDAQWMAGRAAALQ